MSGLGLARAAAIGCGALGVIALVFPAIGLGAGPAKAPAVVDAAGPATQLKIAPKLTRVRFEIAPGAAVVVHELVFPSGALGVAGPASAGPGSLFVAFTAQARPMAIEATRHALDAKGALVDAGATRLDVVDVFVHPATAALLLGAPKSAGHVVKVPRDPAAFGLRIRSAIALSTGAAPKTVSLMARLGIRDAAPLSLDRVEVVGIQGQSVRGARATLCGPAADPTPIVVEFPGFPPSPLDGGAVEAATLTRLPTDDLCVDVQL
ncbi:MAG: hypothetical protein NVS3B10_05190 [Polyangiales bacterium]